MIGNSIRLTAASMIILCATSTCQAQTSDSSYFCQPGALKSEIDAAQKAGSLSHEEATKLKSDADGIERTEQQMRAKNGGTLTSADEKQIEKRCGRIHHSVHKVEAMRPDNTGKNIGDQRSDSPTPQVQSESRSDLHLAQSLRKSLMKDKSLSGDAKNVKVVVINGTVTLRGPVRSSAEKERIAALAAERAGGNVLNELEVKQ